MLNYRKNGINMNIDIISLFPEMFAGVLGNSILKRAQQAQLLNVHITNPRDFTTDKHNTADDYPFGGGSGMVMKPEPLFQAIEHVTLNARAKARVILMCPSGQRFDQQKAIELAKYEQLVLVCGHYEGIDERVREAFIDEAISIGDFVLTGGELAAMVIVDAVARMIPGVLGAEDGAEHDSFYDGLLEYPQYTRPREWQGLAVPEVLLSGNHALINRWRRKESLRKTLACRPDLLYKKKLDPQDGFLLAEILSEQAGD